MNNPPTHTPSTLTTQVILKKNMSPLNGMTHTHSANIRLNIKHEFINESKV